MKDGIDEEISPGERGWAAGVNRRRQMAVDGQGIRSVSTTCDILPKKSESLSIRCVREKPVSDQIRSRAI